MPPQKETTPQLGEPLTPSKATANGNTNGHKRKEMSSSTPANTTSAAAAVSAAAAALLADGDDLDAALNPARGYPRKRVAVACEVCRLRKTKCDAKSPCTFCVAAGIECVYRQTNPGERQSAATDILQRIEDRLARLESYLSPGSQLLSAGTISETVDTPRSIVRTPQEGYQGYGRPTSSLGEARSYNQRAVAAPQYDFAFRQTSGEVQVARPSVISFTAPSYLDIDSWDDTGDFYDEEMLSEERMFAAMAAAYRRVAPDVSPRSVWRLQSLFIHNFLQWMPIFDLRTLMEHIRVAQASQFQGAGPSECLVLLAFAIAAETNDRTHYDQAEVYRDHPPSWVYFWHARDILTSLPVKTRRDATVLQCRILRACYYQIAVRPLLAWDAVLESARDLMHVLNSNFYKTMDDEARDSIHRVFWACSILLHELEAVLKMHPVGLRPFHEIVPLPIPDTEEEGFYYFFAQTTIRKLLTETLDVVGYRVGQVIYAPLVAAELRKQAEQWCDHLPPPIRFPITVTPLFDLRKSYLRLQFVALHTVILWPSVLQMLQDAATGTPASQYNGRVTSTREEAADCIRNCVLTVQFAEELLMQRHMGLNFAIWATYGTLTMLIITYRTEGLSYVPETKIDTYIRKGYTSLLHWNELLFVRRALRRTRAQMIRANIPLDPPSVI